MRRLLPALVAFVAAAPLAAQPGRSAPPRFGVGFDVVSAFYPQSTVPDGPSVGFRGRVALPVNADLSVAASLGAGAYPFASDSDARYLLNPQTEVIVMLPGARVRYLMGGFGGYVPVGGGGGGTSIHAGVGWARPLSETSLFWEVNPALILADDAVLPVLAARAGVIF